MIFVDFWNLVDWSERRESPAEIAGQVRPQAQVAPRRLTARRGKRVPAAEINGQFYSAYNKRGRQFFISVFFFWMILHSIRVML